MPASTAFVTDSNRPQPLWQPPPTACLTASGAACEARSPSNASLAVRGCFSVHNVFPFGLLSPSAGVGGSGLPGPPCLQRYSGYSPRRETEGGVWHKAMVLVCLPLAAPIGLSPVLILTLCGSERVLVVPTEPPDALSCLTTPGVGRPRDGAVAREGGGGNPQSAVPPARKGIGPGLKPAEADPGRAHHWGGLGCRAGTQTCHSRPAGKLAAPYQRPLSNTRPPHHQNSVGTYCVRRCGSVGPCPI